MSHSKRRHTHKHDGLEDIIGMSNDEEIRDQKRKSNNELDDYKNNDDSTDDDETDDDNESDDGSDDSTDDEDDKNYDDEELTAPNIKSKRAKARRHSNYADKEISEVRKSKGVKALSKKLNNNLHQIQIALPYGQVDPQRLPPGVYGYN